MATTVAVIGAGALGLMALKTLKEDGFEVTGFETRPYVGGLWKDSEDSTISVHATTAFNSSKYRSSMSDFPFPDETDDFPSAPQMHQYLTSYSDHFGLTEKVRTNTKVLSMDWDGSKWALEIQPKDGHPTIERFDKVAIASGSFSKPKFIKFPGADRFTGEIIHSIDYHGPEPYKNKNVLLIGVHATAQDTVASLAGVAKKAYLSHRHGLLLLPRYMPNGEVYDVGAGMRVFLILTFMQQWLPRLANWLFDKILTSSSKKAFDLKADWNFSPAPPMAVSTPLIADKLYSTLQSGFAHPVAEVERITGPRTVRLKDGTQLEDIDAIIQCVGYDFDIPFLPPSSPYQPYRTPNSPPHLYRNTFPLHPDPAIRNSLAFLGQAGIPFPGFIAFELLSQAISQIWQGRHHTLPPLPTMQAWHRDNLAWRRDTTRTYGPSSTFYAIMIPTADHVRWLDRVAGTGIFAHFDWAWFNRRAWRLWWSDRELYHLCMNGVLSPTVWRLFDMGGRKVWPGAREQLFRDNEAVKRQKEVRLQVLQKEKELARRVKNASVGVNVKSVV